MSIFPKSGHVIFTGRPSNYQGLIAKHFSNLATKAKSKRPVYFRDLSGEGIPLTASHDRLAVAAGILDQEPGALVITAAHYGVLEPLDLEGFESVARIWECKQCGQSLGVTLTEVQPATGRTIYLQGAPGHSGISWEEVDAPEPAPLGKQRLSMDDGHGPGGPIDPNARTQIGEWQKANPTRKVIQL
jgi:hypothetical protein